MKSDLASVHFSLFMLACYPGVIERYVNLKSTALSDSPANNVHYSWRKNLPFLCACLLNSHGVIEGRKISGRMNYWAPIMETALG